MLFDFLQDLRYALRTLSKSPAFTATALVTLAIGIGSTVGTFSIINTILLRPLPVRAPGELVTIDAQNVATGSEVGASWTKYLAVRSGSHVVQDVAAYISRDLAFSDGRTPQQVVGARVTWNFFSVLGIAPAVGRAFLPTEDVEGAAPVAILSDGFVQRQLGGVASAVVGRSVIIDGRATTIVGVLPAGFRFEFTDRDPQLYLTSVFTPSVMTTAQIQHGAGFLSYVARLKPTYTVREAAADLVVIDQRYREQFGSYVDAVRYRLHAVPFADSVVGDVRPGLLLLMGAVALVLLIACANVAHLLLARATSRQHEVGVRLALGATRARLLRQFLTESLLLAAGGCAVGWWATSAIIDVLIAHGPAAIPRLHDVQPDRTVLAFAIAVSAAAAMLFGLVPALRASRVKVGEVLKDSRAGGPTSRTASRLHKLLAASETAVTVALLIAAALLIQSLVRMQRVDFGFNPTRVYAAHVSLPRAKYPEPYQREAFFTRLLERVRDEPGLQNVGAISYLPMGGTNYGFFFYLEEAPERDAVISVRHVGGDYFRAMQIPLRRGRVFTDEDDARAAPVAIINETAARRYFPDADPIGRRLASTSDRILRQIVGVVADVRFDGPAKGGQEELYIPYRQLPWPEMTIVVNSQASADEVIAALRRHVAALDTDQAIADIRPMTAVVASSMTERQFTGGLLGTFAGIATVLTMIGVYGVMAVFVTHRNREFGIRMALGARPGDLIRLVMIEGLRMIAIGTAVGVAGAWAARRALSGLLFGVTAADVTTYASGVVFVGAVGLIACFLPARRAAARDPLQALRYQ